MLRVALIGLGAAAQNIHLPAYSQLRDAVRVVGGCDIDGAVATLAKKQWRLPEVFANPQEMLEKTQPDIVAICTPPFLHHAHVLMALERGCHVFCEKPLAEELLLVDEIIKAAEAHRRWVVVNTQFPCMNIHVAAKNLIGSPEFGRLLFLHAWQRFRPTEKTEAGWRRQMQRRLCMEFGVHVFELIRFFFADDPVSIHAHMPNPTPARKSEVVNIVSLEFADGRAAAIVLDRLSKGPDRYLEMTLDGEFASIHTAIGGEVRFEIGMHTQERRPFAGFDFVKGGKAVWQNGTRSRTLAKDGINPFAKATAVHFKNFMKALQNGHAPAVTAQHHRHTLALTLAAYDSAQLGRVIKLNDYLQAG